ncbi:MAG: sugar isomerase domain-containing protein [Chloroflexi bacterium]|nr:MAG: sugar isomerase domain-containing protein [Chloroflexota bacterium]
MSGSEYLQKAAAILDQIHSTQMSAIEAAAHACAESIKAGRAVYVFGSGHSVIPTLDLFPRYGGYVGFYPIMDPRLMWFNVTGPGGARELLWLERTEGYIQQVLLSYNLDSRDTMIVYSHGGLNAAPVEMALTAQEKGLTVVAVTCVANRKLNKPTHSSGKSLPDAANIIIDNCCPPEDALVELKGRPEHVGGSSTWAAMAITQAITSETAAELLRMGKLPERIFVSPNVPGVPADNNALVFQDYMEFIKKL